MAVRAITDIKRITAALAALLFFSGAAFAADVVITMPAEIASRPGEIYLGEYAKIEGDRELADAASMAVLRPSGGRLTRDDVVAALGATEVAGFDAALRVPAVIRVVRESRVARELRAITGWKWRIDDGGADIDDTTDFSLPKRIAPGASAVTAKVDDGRGHKLNRQITLRWYQPVIYSTVPIARGDRIDLTKLGRRIETVLLNENNISDISDLRGASPRTSIAAMRAICDADLQHVNVVRSGASVRLVSSVNGLGVEVAGVAMQRGGIGDVIKVKNLSSKKILQGRVIDADRVLIE